MCIPLPIGNVKKPHSGPKWDKYYRLATCLASVYMSKFGVGELLIMALRTLPLPGTSCVISLARTPTKLVQFSCPALSSE